LQKASSVKIQWDGWTDELARSNAALQGLTPEGIRHLLHEFVCSGGRLDEMTNRTYPRRCGKCGQKVMQLATVPYATTIEHDGRVYRVEIPSLTVPQCAHCKAISIDDDADRQISAAFRREAGLLAAEEIRLGREKLGLTQKQFANLLGVGESTVSRWETGAQIQQRAMDRFLRVCLASPAAVDHLLSDFQPSARGG
jgi:putative zinc finger/helix-turn-helix YgiT family protein